MKKMTHHEKDDPSLEKRCRVSVCIYIYMSPSKYSKTESGQGLKFSGVFLGWGKLKNIK